MHPLISYDVAKLMLDDRLKTADVDRRAHEIRTLRKRSHPLRAAVRRGLIALTRPARPRKDRGARRPGRVDHDQAERTRLTASGFTPRAAWLRNACSKGH